MHLVTWNMQGATGGQVSKWQDGILRLFTDRAVDRTAGIAVPDVVCLQEAGPPPRSADKLASYLIPPPTGVAKGAVSRKVKLYNWGGTARAGRRGVAFHEWDERGHRVNLAIVTKMPIDDDTVDVDLRWVKSGFSWRPVLGLETPWGWVYSIHASAKGGGDAAGLVRAVATVRSGKWCVAGDFNREPGTFLLPGDCAFCPPNLPTQGKPRYNKKIDYCVVSPAPQAPGITGRVRSYDDSDHYPVDYDLP
jgi:cytolethal distending toxin subunit B